MDVCIDSRKIKPGQLFIPVKGPHFDGHDFIPDVLKKGGRVLDVDLTSYAKRYRKKLICKVIAVTGSAGKTTVKDMLYFMLSNRFNVVRTQENENNEIGVPLTILKADATTDVLIVEMGMRGKNQIKHLAKIARPTHAVITNIGLAHIEQLKTQRNIAYAKAEIFQAPLKWEAPKRHAYIPIASDYYELLKKQADQAGYRINPFSGPSPIDANLNLCYQVGRQFGMSDEEISAGLSQFKPSSHRLKVHKLGQVTVVDDSYNANPDGVRYALQYLRTFKGRKLLILGDMLELGAKSKAAHQAVVDDAINCEVDVMFTLGEACQAINAPDTLSLSQFKDKQTMHQAIKNEIKPGDAILVKGSRGMKMEDTVDFLIQLEEVKS